MIVRWKGDGMVSLEVVKGRQVTLQPGCNNIPNAKWEEVSESVKNDPRFEEVTNRPAKDGKDAVGVPLSSLSAKDAEDVVKDTYNVKSLEEWRHNEQRDSVRLAIVRQLDLIAKDGANTDALKDQ